MVEHQPSGISRFGQPLEPDKAAIAYFSMEIGLDPSMPTYAGGLGVLAGDTIRSAADLDVPMVAVTLLYRKGYFYQRFNQDDTQAEEPVEWVVDDFVQEMAPRVSVVIEGRNVWIRCFKYEVTGAGKVRIPVYFLDSDLSENSEPDRALTHFLYGGDQQYRLCQEVILGIGGLRMLRALGYGRIERFHMNEGHAALLTLELLEEQASVAGRKTVNDDDVNKVQEKCIFTTHTPVPTGHDQFPMDLVYKVLGPQSDFFDRMDLCNLKLVKRILGSKRGFRDIEDIFSHERVLNMTYLALNLSSYVNGVAKKHSEVSKLMFAEYCVDAITNGVHAATWASEPFQALFDEYISGWRSDNFSLRYAIGIPKHAIWEAHTQAKKKLLRYVNRETNAGMDMDLFTIGFARRAASYKRADLLFHDVERLKIIASGAGPLQIIYSGKAHPQDQKGKELIKSILSFKEQLKNEIRIAYLENYDMELGKMIVAGVDLWLNTPQPPLEASGTSGMKAALNGVPSLSVLDGWWIEGCIEGVTGWSIGDGMAQPVEKPDSTGDAASLYDKLEKMIIPLFYARRDRFIDVMIHAISLNGSFFNTHRMVQEYLLKAYF
jgi:glycogen phosphorylase